MNRKTKLLLCLALIASAMTLVTCKPIDYYLQRVYKAYGKVTDANTGEPLESVEVFVKGYQYSELTNSLGDYEIELAEGTWTLEFVKDGYNTAYSDPPVQVGPTNPRALVDAKLAPKALSICGTWIGYHQPLLGGDSDVAMTLRANGTYETLLYGEGGTTPEAYSQRGTYTCSNSIMHCQVTERYDGSNWVSISETADIPCDISGDGNTLALTLPPGTWVLTQICGTWFGTQGPTPSGGFNDVKLNIGADGTFEALILDVGTTTIKSMSNRGTYTCSSNIIHVQNTEIYDGSNWVPNSAAYDTPYNISGNTLAFYIDTSNPPDGIADATWTFTRQ